jgi:hypothetical protein
MSPFQFPEIEIHPEKNMNKNIISIPWKIPELQKKPPTKHIPEASETNHHRAWRRGDYPLCQSWPIPSPERLGRS